MKEHTPNMTKAHEAVRTLLLTVGEDPDREGLIETPARFVKALLEHCEGYTKDPMKVLSKSFDITDASCSRYDQMILSGPLPFHSHCEHHIAVFEGTAWIAYLPGKHGRVVGLSKLARTLDLYAKRLQVQERLTTQIADAIDTAINPAGVGVLIKARHTCQCHRGIKKDGRMVTSILRGAFLGASVRAEFLELVKASTI